MKRICLFFMVLAMVVVASDRTEAAILTLNDGADVWTLDVQDDGCTVCAVTLEVEFGAVPAHAGAFLDSVQWGPNNPNVNLTNIGFNATNAGLVGDWTFSPANLNANGCSGGNANAVCGEIAGNGFAVVGGATLMWGFTSVFDSPLSNLKEGNIRAAYNDPNGRNEWIFSPGDGPFDDDETIPEPASVALLGLGLAGLVWARRQ